MEDIRKDMRVSGVHEHIVRDREGRRLGKIVFESNTVHGKRFIRQRVVAGMFGGVNLWRKFGAR